MSPEEEFLDAVKKGEVAKVSELLKKDRALAGAKTADGVSAVLLALYYRKKEVVPALLASGIELNIFEASATGQVERVKALLKKEPTLANAFAPDGFTPLGLAAFFEQKEAVKMLLANGAKVNQAAKNTMKVAPLHSAVAARHTEIARLLIDHGADVNARQQADVTPLHEAAANGLIKLAKLLISQGADVSAKMGNGKTPLDLAVDKKQTEMAELLREPDNRNIR